MKGKTMHFGIAQFYLIEDGLRDGSGKPAATKERGLVTDSPNRSEIEKQKTTAPMFFSLYKCFFYHCVEALLFFVFESFTLRLVND